VRVGPPFPFSVFLVLQTELWFAARLLDCGDSFSFVGRVVQATDGEGEGSVASSAALYGVEMGSI